MCLYMRVFVRLCECDLDKSTIGLAKQVFTGQFASQNATFRYDRNSNIFGIN